MNPVRPHEGSTGRRMMERSNGVNKRIGITMRVIRNEGYPEERDALSRDWEEYIKEILPDAILVPLVNEPDSVIDALRGLKIGGVILSNGSDWGEFPRRDKTEERIVKYSLGCNLPILGVCRGMQILNILFGGTLKRGIRKARKENHVRAIHKLDLAEDTPFKRLIKTDKMKVNSFHNHGILQESVSNQFKVFATSPKGVVEGFYHPKKPIVGIQWHPERRSPSRPFDKELIANLLYKGRL